MLSLDAVRIVQGDFVLTADTRVAAGMRCAVVGPSGAGKSTLLDVIAGFYPATEGVVRWDGHDLTGVAPGDRPLSMVFQDSNLFPHLDLRQNVGLGLSPSLRLTAADEGRIAAVLDRVGLAGLAARRPAELSGGQRGRAALARMLIRNRPLALLDEPFAALGPGQRMEMLDLVAETVAERGATCLLVTHDPGEASRFARDMLIVADGAVTGPVPAARLTDDAPAALRGWLGAASGPPT